jgi:GPH family glycoside/pentoside/hexuronide:cation symporter
MLQETTNKKTNAKNYLAIAFGILAAQGLGVAYINSFLSFVYSEFIGVSVAIVGIVLSVGTLVDGLSDFGMGIVIDRVQTKYGKAKHWFLYMAVPLALTTVLVFFCPTGASLPVKVVYLVVIYNLYCTAVTAVRLPVNTMPALISNSPKVRATASFFVAVSATVGQIIVNSCVDPVVNFFGGGLLGYRVFLIILAVVMLVLCLAAFFLAKEVRSGDELTKKETARSQGNIWNQIKNLFKNKYWLIQQGMTIPFFFVSGICMGCMVYFCNFVLGGMQFMGPMTLCTMGGMMLGAVITLPISRRVDGRTVCLCAGLLGIISAVVQYLFVYNNTTLFFVGMLLSGLACGGCTAMDAAMTARTIDYGEWKTGNRQEGLCYSGKAVCQKIAAALAAAFLGFVLKAAGYVEGGAGMNAVSDSVIHAIVFLMVIVPGILFVIYTVSAYFFKLTDKRVEEIQAELRQRNG